MPVGPSAHTNLGAALCSTDDLVHRCFGPRTGQLEMCVWKSHRAYKSEFQEIVGSHGERASKASNGSEEESPAIVPTDAGEESDVSPSLNDGLGRVGFVQCEDHAVDSSRCGRRKGVMMFPKSNSKAST
jgi:hypothetical protein